LPVTGPMSIHSEATVGFQPVELQSVWLTVAR
jgi:hypothetical protein